MRALVYIICASLALSGCGHKGSLKTPTQAAKDAEKKARKKAEKERQEQEKNETEEPK